MNPLNALTITLLAPISLVLGLLLWTDQSAAQTVTLPASQDSFIDLNNPDTNYNAQRLEVTYSNFPGFVPTRFSLLQFDLGGVTAVISRSRLVLSLVENNLPAGSQVSLGLYTADDTWDETTLTYNTAPTADTLLQSLTITAGLTGTLVFDDGVGAYLEGERGGDGTAAFLLRLDGGGGALGFAGSLLFEDREGTADGLNGNEPALDLRPAADLVITKTSTVASVYLNQSITYQLTITNNGPDLAANVVLSDTIPAGLSFGQATSTQGSCQEAGGQVACDLGGLAAGQGASAEIVVIAAGVGLVTNTATVNAATIDPTQTNNRAEAWVAIEDLLRLYLPVMVKSR